jgi:hypothetical protein
MGAGGKYSRLCYGNFLLTIGMYLVHDTVKFHSLFNFFEKNKPQPNRPLLMHYYFHLKCGL